MKTFTVGVFPMRKSGTSPLQVSTTRFTAYTTWYNPQWEYCCEHKNIMAINGTQAKRIAIAAHKANCGKGDS